MNFLNIIPNFTEKFLLIWIVFMMITYLVLVLIGFKTDGRTLDEPAQGHSTDPVDAL
jgi:hypothetical protein